MWKAIESMYLTVPRNIAKEKMGMVYAVSWIKVMKSGLEAYTTTPRSAGEKKWQRQPSIPKPSMPHATFLPRMHQEMEISRPLLNESGKERLAIRTISTPMRNQGMNSLLFCILLTKVNRPEIVQWVSESKHSFEIVSDHGFKSLMKTGWPEY